MSTPNESEQVLLQNDGSNFQAWSIHVLDVFRAISPLVERIVDASIPLLVVDWSNYKNIPKEEDRCVQLNAQAINVILNTLSAEVLDRPRRLVLLNRIDRFFGFLGSSVLRKFGTDRFFKKLGTDQVRFRLVRFGSRFQPN